MSFLSQCALVAPERKFFRIFFYIILFLRNVAGLFFKSQRCLRCGKRSGIYVLCGDCLESFVKYDSFVNGVKKRCIYCGRELISEIDVCSICRTEKTVSSADGVFSLHSYSLWKKDLLYSWKTAEVRVLSPVFARMVCNGVKEVESVAGCSLTVVPVPPRPGKIRKYGWDQINELCWYMKKLYGVTVLELLKRYSKQQQKKLNREHRKEMIESGYDAISSKVLNKIGKLPENVILLDDVMTTGSTVEACSKILKKMGVKRVFVLTIFSVS